MPLIAGTRLGPYEIQSALGAGGMGEVYRARDARLDRTVAIKILPEALAGDPQLRERFDREARAISSLNHPHICTLYDVGRQEGVDFLVMEYLEGETLACRLERGAVPLAEALQIAIQIADALATAHRAGLIHRDLKPGNIFLVRSGPSRLRQGSGETAPVAKLLDFGLAKAAAPAVTAAGLSMLPTTPPTLTQQGTILGTFQYMAPEQLEGQDADARTDIFAFGAVLYELLTGRKAFEGKSHASLIASILEREPAPVSSLQPLTPPALDRIVRKCLAKDPGARWQTARDLHDELQWITERATEASAAAVPAAGVPTATRHLHASLRAAAIAFVILVAVGVGAGATWFATHSTAPPSPVARVTITPPASAALTVSGNDRDVAISPDGTRIAYVANSGSQIFVRSLDQLNPTLVATVSGARNPFFSPDGQWIGFFDGALKKVQVTGGPPVMICATDGNPRGATWGTGGDIIFATNSATSGLWRVSAGGGEATMLTKPGAGEADHLWPEFLPDGRGVLFTVLPTASAIDSAQVAVLDLRSMAKKVVVRGGTQAHYVPTGHLVYGVAGTLRAVAFDLARLEAAGSPVVVLPEVITTFLGAAAFDVAGDGTLVYQPGGVLGGGRTLVWVDRQGREEPIKAPVHSYQYLRLSPDGRRIALDVRDQESDIWTWDFARDTLTRLTFDPAPDRFPVWTADGRRVLFGSDRAGAANLFWQAADGTGAVERLTESPSQQFPMGVSPDGQWLVFRETVSNNDLMLLSLDKERRARPLIRTPFIEQNAEISPDGRWLAYESNNSGRFEVFVRPFPNVDNGQWQISTAGGSQPLWTRNGRELFYANDTGALMSVRVDAGVVWSAGAPTEVLPGRYWRGGGAGGGAGRTYDVSADGRRFLMIKQGGPDGAAAPPSFVVVFNWFEELKRLAPTR